MKRALIFAGIAVAVSCAASMSYSQALPVPELVPLPAQTDNGLQKRLIRLRNVPAPWMAWWLDSRHNPKPRIYSGSLALAHTAAKADDMPARLDVQLPVGVELISADEKQSALIAYGSGAALTELEVLVRKMDVPFRQAEITTRMVEMDAEELAKLNLRFQPATPPPGVKSDVPCQVAIWKGNVEQQIEQWVAAGKAKIISAPRVVVIENLPASIYTTLTTKATLAVPQEKNEVIYKPEHFAERAPALGAAFGVTVWTREVNKEGVTLEFYAGRSLLLDAMENQNRVAQSPSLPRADNTKFLGTDGLVAAHLQLEGHQTAIITGLPADVYTQGLSGKTAAQLAGQKRQTVIFVTALTIHRLPERIPGT